MILPLYLSNGMETLFFANNSRCDAISIRGFSKHGEEQNVSSKKPYEPYQKKKKVRFCLQPEYFVYIDISEASARIDVNLQTEQSFS